MCFCTGSDALIFRSRRISTHNSRLPAPPRWGIPHDDVIIQIDPTHLLHAYVVDPRNIWRSVANPCLGRDIHRATGKWNFASAAPIVFSGKPVACLMSVRRRNILCQLLSSLAYERGLHSVILQSVVQLVGNLADRTGKFASQSSFRLSLPLR